MYLELFLLPSQGPFLQMSAGSKREPPPPHLGPWPPTAPAGVGDSVGLMGPEASIEDGQHSQESHTHWSTREAGPVSYRLTLHRPSTQCRLCQGRQGAASALPNATGPGIQSSGHQTAAGRGGSQGWNRGKGSLWQAAPRLLLLWAQRVGRRLVTQAAGDSQV